MQKPQFVSFKSRQDVPFVVLGHIYQVVFESYRTAVNFARNNENIIVFNIVQQFLSKPVTLFCLYLKCRLVELWREKEAKYNMN